VVQSDRCKPIALCERPSRETSQQTIVVAESLDAALSLIDEGVPDVILLPNLLPGAV
jgi:hypothetical protein